MPYKKIPGIYQIRNTVNHKLYIGSAVSIKSRFTQHHRLLKQGRHFNVHLQASWNKHGADAFVFETVELTSEEKLLEREQYWIDTFDLTDRKKGYNKRVIVSSNRGIKVSDETRKKLSIAHMGHRQSVQTKAKISAAQNIPVTQLSKEGNVIAQFPSLKEAALMTGVCKAGISGCVRKVINSAGGFYWCFTDHLNVFKLPTRETYNFRVYQTDITSGRITEWHSIKAVGRYLKRSPVFVKTLIHNNKTYDNSIWKYKEN